MEDFGFKDVAHDIYFFLTERYSPKPTSKDGRITTDRGAQSLLFMAQNMQWSRRKVILII